MTFKKIYSGAPYRKGDITVNAMPGGTYTIGVGYGSDQGNIKIGSAATYIDQPIAYRYVGLSITGQVVKAFPSRLYFIQISNTSASARYIKIYDKATAPDNNDTPKYTYAISGNQNIQMYLDEGVVFSNGISLRATAVAADNDNTAPGATDIIINATYK